jgi:hypothetical protein
MKILNKVLALTATAALLTSSTLAISNVFPTIGGSFKIIPSEVNYTYDDVKVSLDGINYNKNIVFPVMTLNEDNNFERTFRFKIINESTSPEESIFGISSKVQNIETSKNIMIVVSEEIEYSTDGESSKVLYTGTLANWAQTREIPKVEVTNSRQTHIRIDASLISDFDYEESTAFELSVIPLN